MSEVNIEYLEKAKASQFELIDGCVLRKGAWTKNTLREWQEKLGENTSAIESVINHIHLQTLFWLSENQNLSVNAMDKIGREVKLAWEKTLASKFPERSFMVTCNKAEKDGWVGNMSVTAHQEKVAKDA